MELVVIVLTLVAGVLLGMFIETFRNAKADDGTQGILNIDCSEPDYTPGLYLQLYVPVEDVVDQQQVTFDVNVIN